MFELTMTTADNVQHEPFAGPFETMAGAKAFARDWIKATVEASWSAETEGQQQRCTPIAVVVWTVRSGRVAAIVGNDFTDSTLED